MTSINNINLNNEAYLDISFADPPDDYNAINILSKPEPFETHLIADLAQKLAEDPIRVYSDLKNRRISRGINFSFPEAAETIDLLAKQVINMGQSSPINESYKRLSPFLNTAQMIKSQGFPYYNTLLAIHQFLEDLHLYYNNIGSYKNIPKNFVDVENPPQTMHVWTSALTKVMNDPSFILFPTTKKLSPGYFAKIQSVRAYPLGVTVDPYTKADGRYKSPTHFFTHDMEHTSDGENAFQKLKGEESEEEKSQRLQRNYLTIKEEFKLKSKEEWRACKLLLFNIFHEPGAVKADPDNLKIRLADDNLVTQLKNQIQERCFGNVYSELIPFLETAKSSLCELVESGKLEKARHKD